MSNDPHLGPKNVAATNGEEQADPGRGTRQATNRTSSVGIETARRWVFGVVTSAIALVVIGALSSFVVGRFGEHSVYCDLASHFRVQAGLVGSAGGFLLVLCWRSRAAWALFLAGLALLLTLWPYALPTLVKSEAESHRLMIHNVLMENHQKEALAANLLQEDADIILLFETDSHWSKAMSGALSERWPHQELIPRRDHLGMCVFSKRPWDQLEIFYATGYRAPAVDLRFVGTEAGQPTFRLFATHAVAPMGEYPWQARNSQFALVEQWVSAGDAEHTLVAGDLNCTVWAPSLQRLVRRTGLRDSARGFGVKFTWGVESIPFGKLAIDQVLVGDAIRVVNHRVGPKCGSDHHSVIVDFHVAP